MQRLFAAMAWLAGWVVAAGSAVAVDYPGPAPGKARVRRNGPTVTLENDLLSATWEFGAEGPRCLEFRDRTDGRAIDCQSRPWFVVHTGDGKAWEASQFRFNADGLRVEAIAPVAGALRAADRCGGQRIATLLSPHHAGFAVAWEAELRDGANYIRQRWRILSLGQPAPVRMELFDGACAGAQAGRRGRRLAGGGGQLFRGGRASDGGRPRRGRSDPMRRRRVGEVRRGR